MTQPVDQVTMATRLLVQTEALEAHVEALHAAICTAAAKASGKPYLHEHAVVTANQAHKAYKEGNATWVPIRDLYLEAANFECEAAEMVGIGLAQDLMLLNAAEWHIETSLKSEAAYKIATTALQRTDMLPHIRMRFETVKRYVETNAKDEPLFEATPTDLDPASQAS